ncbi:MAG: nucleotidyltransferase family protein [Gammaproteobacteria bacterium]|nr:nucleotidyltransferase family protein [Gammaproteobacteria bacterium]MBT8152064.1 nucleotidyltransferase family protein [Gammaproteobacteria bacterium]NND38232.1 nucleotidyltransferase family protein [Pseudomonadales bacterium]NNM12036.1 nucleotidyltransferase family protein [Pseudomonadales bacterium]RZV59964.1 MAG: nucleotidyltransferase family protein [Pseudomonadales bacterium]
MLLAAGRGERMRPLTDRIPKPLVEVAGVALIEHHLQNLAAAGVRDVVVNHAHLGEQIEQRLGDGARFGLRIRYSREPEGALETAGGILRALPMLCESNDSFLVVNADIFSDYDFAPLLQHDLAEHWVHLVMVDTPSFKTAGDFALLPATQSAQSSANAGFEVAETGEELLTFSGISLMSTKLFAGCEPGRAALKPLLVRAMQNHCASGEHYCGEWYDVGTVERLQWLNEHCEGKYK